jgi:hypothetical protein
MLWLSLFNNIIASCIAAAIISPDCFYYAFVQDNDVVTSFTINQCDGRYYTGIDGFQCVSYVNVKYDTVYSPPYAYRFQCTSSLLTSFANIFIFHFIIHTFVNPP